MQTLACLESIVVPRVVQDFVMNVFQCKGNVSNVLCWLDFEASITSKNFHQCAELRPILRTFRLFGASGDGMAWKDEMTFLGL